MIGRGRSKNDPRYGKGKHTINLSADESIDEAGMKERILAAFRDPNYRPPTLPSVAMELLELSRKPDVSFDAVVTLLEQDSMLAGRVLRIAQSPIYVGASRIESLRDALVRMGLKTLRDVVLEAAANLRVFRCEAYAGPMERLSKHSMATAYLARLVSRHTSMPDEFAFLCGLLHDIGIAGILIALGEVKRGEKPPELTMLWPAIDGAHEEAGAIMAGIWQLPAEIPLVLGAHHRVRIEGMDHPLAATICLADHMAQELGLGMGGVEKESDTDGQVEDVDLAAAELVRLSGAAASGRADRTPPSVLERAREALRLSEDQLARIQEEGRTALAERFSEVDVD